MSVGVQQNNYLLTRNVYIFLNNNMIHKNDVMQLQLYFTNFWLINNLFATHCGIFCFPFENGGLLTKDVKPNF